MIIIVYIYIYTLFLTYTSYNHSVDILLRWLNVWGCATDTCRVLIVSAHGFRSHWRQRRFGRKFRIANLRSNTKKCRHRLSNGIKYHFHYLTGLYLDYIFHLGKFIATFPAGWSPGNMVVNWIQFRTKLAIRPEWKPIFRTYFLQDVLD